MMQQNEISQQYLDETYKKLQQEHMRLMNELNNNNNIDDQSLTKQISLLNTLILNLLKFKNLKKSIEDKKYLE